jgi:hypothetical protein
MGGRFSRTKETNAKPKTETPVQGAARCKTNHFVLQTAQVNYENGLGDFFLCPGNCQNYE